MSERAIFIEALEKDDPAERAAFLDQACADDRPLRQRIERLLKAHEPADGFLEHRPPGLGETVDEPPIAERPGTVIGPYKLMEQIGEGGMGLVFVAEQQHPVRRKVALKIIKPGMDSSQVIARFEAERQALAMMDHQNIAKVHDAGTTESGRPYFVMELVHGVPITDYCDANKLTPRRRLELFVPVCQAIQHAHQKGIIHRDIKPSNILVTMYDDKPVPKVIDFGVAKAIEQRLTEKTVYTQFGTLVGTFEYMSPEQAEMNAFGVDTRSDIYALGVLLYELLTGTTPLERPRLREAAFGEIVRLIKEEEAPRPSVRLSTSGMLAKVAAACKTDPAKLSRLVRGELDWVVMRCLEKDRSRRYDTASGLARDVERYLRDEPVEAGPPSAGYRLRKLARRYKKPLTAAAAFAVLLLAGTVVSAWQAVRATRAETAARAAEEEATKDRDRADEALQEKTTALQREQEALQEKTTALQREQEALQEKTQTVYYQNIALAERQLSAGNVGRAEELLNDCSPQLRGWEWHFLKRQRYGNAPPLNHSNTARSVVFSPDGRQIASGCWDGTIQIWDAGTGSVHHHLHQGHKDGPDTTSLTYSWDGQHLAAADSHGDIRVWQATTGELLAAFQGPKHPIWKLAFSPDGRTLASASFDGSVKLWDLGAEDKKDADRLIRPPLKHPTNVETAAFRADGQLLTACWDGRVRTWDLATGQEAASFPVQVESGWVACFSPDARRLAWAYLDGTIRVWDTATGREESELRSTLQWIKSVTFSPNGRRIALAGGGDGTVRLLDVSTGRETLTIYAHRTGVADVAFSPDGLRLASASYDHTVRVWDATPLAGDPQAEHCVTLPAHKHQVRGVAFSPDSRWLASASYDGTVKLWELSGRSQPEVSTSGPIPLRYTLRHRDKVLAVRFSPDNRTLASVSRDQTLNLWDLEAPNGDALTERRTIPLTQGAMSMAFSPEGRLLAIGQGGGIAIYDPATEKQVHPFKRTLAPVPGLAFGPDGRLYSSGASDPTLKVWDASGEKPLLTIPHEITANMSVAVSPDGRLIASAGPIEDGNTHTVRIWDAQTGAVLKTRKGHLGYVGTVAFSPKSRYLASGSWDSTIKVWDLKALDSAEPVTLRGHTGYVYSVAFRPDGRRLASASGYADRGEVKVWDAALWQDPGKRGAFAP